MVTRKSVKKEFRVDYILLPCPLVMLWNCISTPEGLAEWFADKVKQEGNIWTFSWNGSEQSAHLLFSHNSKAVRFRWDGDPHNTYFEFRILRDELTNTVSISVTDFAEPCDIADQKQLWSTQIDDLRRLLRV